MPFGRPNPFEEIEELLERMGREFDAREWPIGAGAAADVADHGDRYVVTADLPGFDREAIEVRLAGRMLAITADRDEAADEDVDYLRRERRREPVERRISLPNAVEVAGVSASYSDGVLQVDLPKREADGGTRIDVE